MNYFFNNIKALVIFPEAFQVQEKQQKQSKRTCLIIPPL